jgi:hypothetical protein
VRGTERLSASEGAQTLCGGAVIARLETVLAQRTPFTDDRGGTLAPLRTLFASLLDLPRHRFVDGVRFLITFPLLPLGHGTSACRSG